MIEMNICYRFDPIYWQTACMTVDAGLAGDQSESVNYDKLATAVGKLKSKMMPPTINKSGIGFTPDVENGKILFGLKPITGLGDAQIGTIIKNRPYANFEEFYEKNKEEAGFTPRVFVTLIKSGVFDEFEPSRRKMMVDYINLSIPKKKKLTMVNLPKVLECMDDKDIIAKHKKEIDLYTFKNKAFGREAKMTQALMEQFLEEYSDAEIVMKNKTEKIAYHFDYEGNLQVDAKSFKKYYDRNTEGLKSIIASDSSLEIYNKYEKREFWKTFCLGTEEAWEMEALAFYHDKHEFEGTDINTLYNVADFNEMSEDPTVVEKRKWGKRDIYIYQIQTIAGTVISKDKNKGLLSILTETGVVQVKYNRDQFAFYNRKDVETVNGEKVVTSDTWFKRGSIVVIHGFRRGETFVPKVYKNTGYDNTTQKITIRNKKAYVTFEK